MKNIVKNITIVCIISLITLSCEKVPKYNKTPEISFAGFDIKRDVYNELSAIYGDSVTIKINYKDGDGDLGLSTNDLGNYGNNYILSIRKKNNGVYEDLVLDPPLDGKFPKLSIDNVVGPIDGVLGYGVYFPHSSPFSQNDTLKFEIYILDRANNKSNVIETSNLIIYIP